MFGLGAEELLIILVIVLVLFGGKKLPELSRSIGQSIRELRKGLSGNLNTDEPTPKKTSSSKTNRKGNQPNNAS
jgi:TatA/E family protein of Tat protein translocase